MKKIYLNLALVFAGCISIAPLTKLYAQVLTNNISSFQTQSGNSIAIQPISSLTDQKLNGSVQLILQFEEIPNATTLNQYSISNQGYLGNHTIIALIKDAQKFAESGIQNLKVKGWAFFTAKEKIGFTVETSQKGNVEILVNWDKNFDKEILQNIVSKYQGSLLPNQKFQNRSFYAISIAANQLEKLAQHEGIVSISNAVTDEPLLDNAKSYVGAGRAIANTASNGLGLIGKDIVIGIGDDSNPFHPDMNDRLLALNPLVNSAHGHHVSGTVAGAGLINQMYTGFAPKSDLISNYFSQIIAETDNYITNYGMTITNNSYGANLNNCNYFGLYDGNSQYIDNQVAQNDKLLHVFAAANSAVINCPGSPNGYRTVGGHYQPSKNVLVVANKGKNENIFNNYSSIGPVKDGRLKPEITAVGTDLIATGNNNNYFSNTGTSMASPNVAGAAGLVSEYYVSKFATKPDGALLKALLMNGADDIGTPGPDFKFGFGLMNVDNSLNMVNNSSWVVDSINSNQTKSFNVLVPSNVAKLKIMLYWHDPAGNPAASKMLVNDLDMSVQTPTATTLLPWVLDHTGMNVTNPAIRSVDRLNNVEQVTLDYPTAGTYQVHVNGFDIPFGSQKYYVLYDYVYDSLKLRFPLGGESVAAGNAQYIYWSSPDTTSTTTVQISTNNGASWTNIATGLNGKTQSLWYTFPSVNSTTCLVKVIKGSKEITSGVFAIIQRPTGTLAPQQCPGHIKINWNANTAASAYQVFINDNGEMKSIATTSNTTYTIPNLSQDSLYWVAVAPVVNGVVGMRSIAISRQPNSGTCTDFNNGDLTIIKDNMSNGRAFTSNALTNKTPLIIEIGNQSNTATNSFDIKYKINSGAWNTKTFNTSINQGSKITLTVDSVDLSVAGNHAIILAIKNNSQIDLNNSNDTFVAQVTQIANLPLDLGNPYVQDFESTNFKLIGQNVIGTPSIENLDINSSNKEGRAQSYILNTISLEGQNSLSLDNTKNLGAGLVTPSVNEATFTYNLSDYNNGYEVRLDFNYRMSGIPKFDTLNAVYLRANDQLPWTKLLDYQYDENYPDSIYFSGSLSLTDLFKTQNNLFSSSVQLKFVQSDTSLISSSNWGNGVTIDNINLYTVTNDIMLVSVDSIYHYNCDLGDKVAINVKVANGVDNPVDSIYVSYQIDNNPVVTEMIPSIAAKDTIMYTFTALANLSSYQAYNLDVWVYQATDTYQLNDSILDINIVNQPLITSFPYVEGFENSNGSYFAEGLNNSWQHTIPQGEVIKKAANGKYVWKTGLTNHNDNEISRLYSPCFDISSLSNPMLSINLSYQIEAKENDHLFDYAFIEYSNNGTDWVKLNTSNNAFNWYNNTTDSVWEGTQKVYWQGATTAIPKTGNTFSFRVVFMSDQGATADGIAIDDIHIYDNKYPIFNNDGLAAPMTKAIGSWSPMIDYLSNSSDSSIILSIGNNDASYGNVSINTFVNNSFFTNDGVQYYLPKNFVVHAENNNGDSATLRMFVRDDMMNILRNDKSCYSCTKPLSVHELGITRFKDNQNKKYENGTLADNIDGTYEYVNEEFVNWIPYLDGYYAEVALSEYHEIWFNDGGPSKQKALTEKHIDISAVAIDLINAQVSFNSYIDTLVGTYALQRLNANQDFETIQTYTTQNASIVRSETYVDAPMITDTITTYRIIYTLANDTTQQWFSTKHAIVNWLENGTTIRLYPNPVTDGKIILDWIRSEDAPLYYEIVNSVGRVLHLEQLEPNLKGGRYTIDLNKKGIANGLYFIRVHSQNNKKDFKISIQN